MTREEYLNELKGRLTSLTDEEKSEALQYYSDYFEDADDDEKVIKELGSPEETAKTIMEKFSNALTASENEEASSEKTEIPFDSLCFDFSQDEITSVSMDLGACHAVFIPGNKWMVETRGIRKDNFTCFISNKTLVVNSIKKMGVLDFFSHEHKSRIIPRILITVPANANLDEAKIRLGAGLLKTKPLSLNCKKASISVGAGNLILSGIASEKSDIKCGMGNMELSGSLKGRTNVDCGMGAVNLKLDDKEDSFSFDCKVGLGDFRFNDKKYSGVQNVTPGNKKENHISVNVGMGSVLCKTK